MTPAEREELAAIKSRRWGRSMDDDRPWWLVLRPNPPTAGRLADEMARLKARARSHRRGSVVASGAPTPVADGRRR